MIKWKNGKSFMGKLPFGYYFNKDNKCIEIENNKKNIVEQIYKLYIDNRLSFMSVAERLTKDGIPTPSMLSNRKDASTRWNTNTVKKFYQMNHIQVYL